MLVSILLAAMCTTSLQAACAIQTTGVSFGSYGPLDPQHLDSRGTIEVSCQEAAGTTVTVMIRLSAGTHGSFTPRTMSQGSARLSYGLYTDSAHSREWGDGSSGTEMVVDTLSVPEGGRIEREFFVFARLFARQSVHPGPYTDQVELTLEMCAPAGQCEVAMVTTLAIN